MKTSGRFTPEIMRVGKGSWKSVREGRITPQNAKRPEEIIALVRLGKMTPDQAENWAECEGMPPFAGRPDPSIFDPMARPSWTPLQVVAWIAYRDVDKVRDASTEFRINWYVWREVAESDNEWVQSKNGMRLEHVSDASLLELLNDDAIAPSAENELIARLIAGDVTCSGFMNSGGQRAVVPAIQWNDLRFHFGGDNVALVSMWQDAPVAAMVHYTDLLIERARVLELWPSPSPSIGDSHSPDLTELLNEAIKRKGAPLGTREAEEIASRAGAIENQKKVGEVLESIQGKQKQGPRGPRTKRA